MNTAQESISDESKNKKRKDRRKKEASELKAIMQVDVPRGTRSSTLQELVGKTVVGLATTLEHQELCFFLSDATNLIFGFEKIFHIENVFSLGAAEILAVSHSDIAGVNILNIEIRDQPIAVIHYQGQISLVQHAGPFMALREEF